MHATDEAERKIDRIASRVDDKDGRRELRSHLYEAGAQLAAARGAAALEAQDVQAAVDAAGGEAALARPFERPARASLGRRAAAHALDVAIVHGSVLLVWTAGWIVAALIAASMGTNVGWLRPDPFQFLDVDDIPGPAMWDRLPFASLLGGALVGLIVLGLPFLYFLVGDMRGGRTIGKRALGIRAVGPGGRVGWGPAALRAALKASVVLAPLLLLDAMFGRGGRWSDRALGVAVTEA